VHGSLFMLTLKAAECGKAYRVINIKTNEKTGRHLRALGLSHNAPVELLSRRRSGTAVIKFRGVRFAVGSGISAAIEVGRDSR